MYFNGFRNDFSSVFKETLRGHLNFSVTLYCTLWRKCYVIFVTLWIEEGPEGKFLMNVTGLTVFKNIKDRKAF